MTVKGPGMEMSQKPIIQSHQEIKNGSNKKNKLDHTGKEQSPLTMPQIFSSPKEYDYNDLERNFIEKSATEETTPGASAVLVGAAPLPVPSFLLKNMD